MQPHRQDAVSRDWLLDARLGSWLNALTGRDPYAVQTMFYFKPPGARGQALHQDQYYLRVQPGTCIAAWMAVDRCDRETGCLQVVPGTRDVPVLCTEQADHDASFSSVTVPLPPHLAPEDVIMEPGDVLLFNGQVIHGSLPNRSRTRFRRALIGHYIAGEAQQVAHTTTSRCWTWTAARWGWRRALAAARAGSGWTATAARPSIFTSPDRAAVPRRIGTWSETSSSPL